MNDYLESIVKQLRNHSETLDIVSIIIDKPWVLFDEEFEIQTLLFKNDKELIITKKGKTQTGKWDYFPETKSLFIDRNFDTILCREAFINQGVMIFQLDGIDKRLFVLANENIIPDLDAIGYLKKLRCKKLNLTERKLDDGRIIEVQRSDVFLNPTIGNLVKFNDEPVEDGKFKLADSNKYYEIKKGKIIKILYEMKYQNPDGLEIDIQQQESRKISKEDYVFISGKPVDKVILNFSTSKNLVVRQGKVVRLELKNLWTRSLSRMGF